jgi:hypothetical protein
LGWVLAVWSSPFAFPSQNPRRVLIKPKLEETASNELPEVRPDDMRPFVLQ